MDEAWGTLECLGVTALVAVRIEILLPGQSVRMSPVTALVAVRIEIQSVSYSFLPTSRHRPCGGED